MSFLFFVFVFFMIQSMLRQYGPSVPEELLLQLVNAFGELRSRADQGLISYPYSTREVVSVVKHLQVMKMHQNTKTFCFKFSGVIFF